MLLFPFDFRSAEKFEHRFDLRDDTVKLISCCNCKQSLSDQVVSFVPAKGDLLEKRGREEAVSILDLIGDAAPTDLFYFHKSSWTFYAPGSVRASASSWVCCVQRLQKLRKHLRPYATCIAPWELSRLFALNPVEKQSSKMCDDGWSKMHNRTDLPPQSN
jgi:hypothetical protein